MRLILSEIMPSFIYHLYIYIQIHIIIIIIIIIGNGNNIIYLGTANGGRGVMPAILVKQTHT